MNLIKRHKGLALVLGLTIILFIILFIISARMIFSTGETEYGSRLEGLVKIDKSITSQIIEEIGENTSVEDITIRTQGKIIYTTITFKEGSKIAKAKEVASKTLTYYDEEILSYYDLCYTIKENIKAEEDEDTKKGFIAAGTKHPQNNSISWTKS